MKKIKLKEEELVNLIEKLVKENLGNGNGTNFGIMGTPTAKYKEMMETKDLVDGGEAGMIYLISDNATPKREINISENDILRESKKYFGWRNASVKRIKSLGSTDYDKFIEFLYKKGYGKDEYAKGGMVDGGDTEVGFLVNKIKFLFEEFELGAIDVFELIKRIKKIIELKQ